jgi:hypothetical protein
VIRSTFYELLVSNVGDKCSIFSPLSVSKKLKTDFLAGADEALTDTNARRQQPCQQFIFLIINTWCKIDCGFYVSIRFEKTQKSSSRTQVVAINK